MATAKEAKWASAELDVKLGVVKRAGGQQLTFEGLPLYCFTEEGAGQLEGDGVVDDFDGTHFEWAAATTALAPGLDDEDPGFFTMPTTARARVIRATPASRIATPSRRR